MPDDRHKRLARAAQAKHDRTLQRAQTALNRMRETGGSVTIALLAKQAGVSRSWIYTQPELRAQVEQAHQDHESSAPSRTANAGASTESLLRRLELAHAQITELRATNHQLRDALARTHGQLRVQKLTQ